jgi:hypothetical protein
LADAFPSAQGILIANAGALCPELDISFFFVKIVKW